MLSGITRSRWSELILILLTAIGAYALHYYPYFEFFGQDIFFFNDPDDAKVYSWNTWHFAHQVKNGTNPFFTDYVFSPVGSSLWMHAYTVWFGLLNILLDNVPLSINLGIAIQLIVAFTGFYYFAKPLVIRPILAVLVAYISVFNTYVLAKSGVHYNLILIGILPFLLLSIHRLLPVNNGRLSVNKNALFSLVLFLFIAFFMEYYVVFYALAFGFAYVSWFGFLSSWFQEWNWKKALGIASIFGVGHVALRLLRIGGFDEKGAVWGAADIRLLLTPASTAYSQKNWILEGIPHTLNDNKIYLGISFFVYFIAALVFFIKHHKRDTYSRFLLFSSALFLLVTLPVIRIAEIDIFFHFTSIVHYLPFVNNVRAPDRFILMFFVMASLFICRVVYLETRHEKDSKKCVALTLTLAVWFFIDHQQARMQPVDKPVTGDVLVECRDKRVLMLPFGIRDGYHQYGELDENHLLLQQQFGFKMPSGYFSRVGSSTWGYFEENELYQNIVAFQKDSSVVDFNWSSAFRQEGIEAIYIGHQNSIVNKNWSLLFEQLKTRKHVDAGGVLHIIESYDYHETILD